MDASTFFMPVTFIVWRKRPHWETIFGSLLIQTKAFVNSRALLDLYKENVNELMPFLP
tara:strand:+ start:524 stop:697 length:174 start_codon:yes stop_codon:yes gene_type:complete